MSGQQGARASADSHKARDWASSLVNRFEDQLPHKAGPAAAASSATSQLGGGSGSGSSSSSAAAAASGAGSGPGPGGQSGRPNLEELKRCLVQISRHRFSEVVSKLAEFLRNAKLAELSNRQPMQQRQHYESAVIVLDALRRCFEHYRPETSVAKQDAGVVKDKLLPEICQTLRIPTDSPQNVHVKNLASKVLFALSSNFFGPIYNRITSRLTDLCRDDNSDYCDIELVQHLNIKTDNLIKLLQVTVDKFAQLALSKRSAPVVWISSLEKALNNWIDMYPQEVARIMAQPVDELENACSQLFDLVISESAKEIKKNRPAVYLSLPALLLALSPKVLSQIGDHRQKPSQHEKKWDFFWRMKLDFEQSRHYAPACARLCKASTYVDVRTRDSILAINVDKHLSMLRLQLFSFESKFTSKGVTSVFDIDLMIDCFLSYFRIMPSSELIFQDCLAERATVVVQFVLVRALYKIVSEPQLPWWPNIKSFYPMSDQLRQFFARKFKEAVPAKLSTLMKSKDQSKSKDRVEETAIYNNLILYMIQLVHAEPMLFLNSEDQADTRESTTKFLTALVLVALQSPMPDVAHEAMRTLLVLHHPDKIKAWNPNKPIDMFWHVSIEVLFTIGKTLLERKSDNATDLLKWLREILNCRNLFLAQNKDCAFHLLESTEKRNKIVFNNLEGALLMHLWSIDTEAVLTAMSCLALRCDEANIRCGSDDATKVTSILPNYYSYMDLSKLFTILTTANRESRFSFYENSKGRKELQERILCLLRKIENNEESIQIAWYKTSICWNDAVRWLTEEGQSESFRGAIRRRASHQNSEHELEDRITEWAHMTGFLCALGGVYLFDESSPSCNYNQHSVDEFVSKMLILLMQPNEKCSEQILQMHRYIKELIPNQMSPVLYRTLFNKIKEIVDKFFNAQGQITLADVNTRFVDYAISIIKSVLDKSDQQSEYLDIANIEVITLSIVRYVRTIDTTLAIDLKIAVCQLVDVMMKCRDYLSFRHEIKFRNKLVEYLSDWVMGTNNPMVPLGDNDVYCARKLDEACMRAMTALLYGLPLHPEDSDQGNVTEAKKQLFVKYFTLFMNLLSDCNEAMSEYKDSMTKERLEAVDKLTTLRDCTIQAMSNLLSANIDSGLLNSIDLGYNRDQQTRAAFMEVLTKILQQGTEFDTLADTARADRYQQLVQLVTMISDKGKLPIAMALASVVTSEEMDELARVFVTVFESKHLLSPLLWNIFYREVELSDGLQTLFRGNSLGSKIMSLCCQIFGSKYLQNLLSPLIAPLLADTHTSYEVNPAKCEPGEDIEQNRRNLIRLTTTVFNKIVSSIGSFPPHLRMMCHCLYQVLCKRFPSNPPSNVRTVGTMLFLRFINPAIVTPREFGIVHSDVPTNVYRGLTFMCKILQNIANHVEFTKEQYMMPLNDLLRENFEAAQRFFLEIVQDSETAERLDDAEPFVSEVNYAALHRLLYTHQEAIGNYLSSSRDHKDVGRRPFDKLAILLAYLGEPQGKSADLDMMLPSKYYTRWARSEKVPRAIEEAVMNLGPHEKDEFKLLKNLNIFYQGGVSKKKNPVFYYIARRFKANEVNVNLLYLYVMVTLQSSWDSSFEVVCDLTHICTENRFRFENVKKYLQIGSNFERNLEAVYFLNCNTWAREFIKFHDRWLFFKIISDRVHFIDGTKKLSDFIEPEQQRLPGATLSLDEDLKVFTNALRMANKDTKVTIKVGTSSVQITSTEKSKVLSQGVFLNDVYYASEIDRVCVVDDNQFTMAIGNELLNFIHSDCEAIVQAIIHIRSRWELSQPETLPVHPKIRPKDVPGTLLNMALLNMGSSDSNVRTAAYNQLCALTATFDLKISRQLFMTPGLCIPSNNTIFIKRISELLAANDAHLTLEFLEECIQGFRVSTIELKHLCLEYMTPWLNNLVRFYKPNEEGGKRQKQVNQILEKLITLTIEEVEMYPSIQTKIWSTIGSLPELIDPVLENFIQRALHYDADSPMVEVMANTAVALASSNVELVASKMIERLCRVIKNTSSTPTTLLEQNSKWPDIVILARYLLMLSFNNCLDVGKHLPDIFHTITLLVGSGSLTMRASTHGLVINVLHSLCTCSSPVFSEDTYRVLRMSLDELSLPKFLLLFGISNVKSATVSVFRSSSRYKHETWFESERPDSSQDQENLSLTNLEIITDSLLEVMEACMRDVPDSRWLERWTFLAKSFAFSSNRALKPRALIVFGCISKSIGDEEIKQLLQEFISALDRFDTTLLEAIVICLTRLQPLLTPESQIHRYLFWVALAMLQLENASLYASGLALLEQNLHTLDSQGTFDDKSLVQAIMSTREPMDAHFSKLDAKLGLSFKSNFHFALVGYLLKGYWHPNPTTVTRNARVLTMLLGIVAKPHGKDKFEVTPENVAYLAALVPVSDEVRNRCRIRYSLSQNSEELGSSEYILNTPGSFNLHMMSTSPAKRRQKSWDLLDQTAITRAKEQKFLLHQSHFNNENKVLLDSDILTDPLTQTLVLTVLATLVKHSTNEDQTRILYEYLAESSYVFPRVFPVIYNFLDQKISNIVMQSNDQRTLSAVQMIIQNGIACEDTSLAQLHSLQNSNLSGLWRFPGSYTNSTNSPENAQYFLELFKSMKDVIWSNEGTRSHSSLSKRTSAPDPSRIAQMSQSRNIVDQSFLSSAYDRRDPLAEERSNAVGQAGSSTTGGGLQP